MLKDKSHIYDLKIYGIDRPRGQKEKPFQIAITVVAATAQEAVERAARGHGYPGPRYASLTSRHQRDKNQAVRDNAHLQVHGDGQVGFAAQRSDAHAEIRALDRMTTEQYQEYLDRDGIPVSRDAFALAGYKAY